MFLLYNIVSGTVFSVVICVDFLDTHIASLVLSSKTRSDTSSPAVGLAKLPSLLALAASDFHCNIGE